MLVKKSAVALAATYVAAVAVSITGPRFLPAYYYFDADTIRNLMLTADAFVVGDSFNNTALAYRWLGFGTLLPDWSAGPFSLTGVYLALLTATGLGRARWRPWLFALFAAWSVPLAIYDGTYSKDTLALIVVAAMTRLCGSARGVAAAAVLALAYAVAFRTYWGVVIALWLTMLVTWRAGGNWSLRLAATVLMIVPLSLAAYRYAGIWLTDGRTIVMEGRELIADAATMFANPFANTSPLTDLMNTMTGWMMLLIPAYLVSLGGLQHVAFAVFQLANTCLFVATLWRANRVRRAGPFDWRLASAASFCITYSMVQGMFEPDFGSFAKHETILLPMYFYVLVNHAFRGGPDPGVGVAFPILARGRG